MEKFAGVNWASAEHALCVVDKVGERLRERLAHPNQAKAARERYSVARGKSDRFDAFVLAELARTDAHRLRAISPDSDETKALRALTRTREDLVGVRVELANQLRAHPTDHPSVPRHGDAVPRSCWSGCAPRLADAPARSRPRHAAPRCSAWSPP